MGSRKSCINPNGIPKTKVCDAVSLNGTELMGATIGATAILFQWKTKDIKTFSEIVFNLGLSAAVALNPLLLMVMLVSLARAFHLSKKHGASPKTIVQGGLKGLILSGSFLTIMGLLSGPIWLNLLIGLVSLFVLRYLYSKAEEQIPALVNHISDQIKLLIVGQLPLVQYHFQRLSLH
ncbi:MAG: hypothetical protein OXE77_11055 [Flavobacteriaceae bacterium]|nr:hypothetical protein [Flavobacteriaceae bacterium]MCY4268130.1 hypothetical protein [Flavobacteriaceae bacterium]